MSRSNHGRAGASDSMDKTAFVNVERLATAGNVQLAFDDNYVSDLLVHRAPPAMPPRVCSSTSAASKNRQKAKFSGSAFRARDARLHVEIFNARGQAAALAGDPETLSFELPRASAPRRRPLALKARGFGYLLINHSTRSPATCGSTCTSGVSRRWPRPQGVHLYRIE